MDRDAPGRVEVQNVHPHDEAAALGEAAGIEIIMNRCRKSSSAGRRRIIVRAG